MHEKELNIDSLKEFKSEKEKLKDELRELQISKTDIQKKLAEQVQNKNRLNHELEQLISWIERIDTQPANFQITPESGSENGIIEKLRASIVKKTKERSKKERLMLDRNEELNRQMEELKSRASSEQMAQQRNSSSVSMKERSCLIREKQEADQIQELEHQIDHLKEALTQQHESSRTNQGHLEAALRREAHLTAELTDSKRLGLADKKQDFDTGLLRELKNLIKWIERGDRQLTDDQMTTEEESENRLIKKIKASIIETTTELKNKEKQLLQRIDESGQQISVLRQRLSTEGANQRKLDEEVASERDKLMQNNIIQLGLLKNGEKQRNARIQALKHQVTELQQSLAREQQMHQASLRNSDENLYKQLKEKDRIHEAQVQQLKDEIHDLRNEMLQLRKMLKQQEIQNKSPRKDLGQVATRDATLVTDITDLKQKHLNTKNTYDNSTAVQIAASRKPILLTPTGIRNTGNTCYFGATMQNLVHTVLLTEELQSPTDVEQLLTKAYIEFIPKYNEANCDQTFRHMYKAFCKKSSRFADRGQHDSHDLFVNFLNCLRDEERRRLGSVNSPGFRNVLTTVDKVFGGHTITVYVCSTCKTPYHVCEPFLDISVPILGPKDGGEDEEEDLFSNHLHNPQSIGGHDPVRQAVETTMKPLGIQSRLKTQQRFFQKRLLMSVSTGDISLKQCLVYYSRTEQIHNEYLCNPCETTGRPPMTSALKRTLIYNPPAVLVLHLKRFEQTTVGFKKCNQRVTYDEYLDIGPYCSSSCLRMREPDDANIWYSLYGVVVHKGSLTSGHYISYIKVRDCDTRQAKQFIQQTFLNRDQVLNEDDIGRINASRGMVRSRKEWEPREVEGQWFLADDEYVKVVEKTEALSQEAYLLFYERVAK